MNASLIDARNELSTYKESLSQAETRAERLRREIQLLEKRVLASAQETLSSDDPNPKPTSIEGSGGKTKSEPQSPGVENEAGSTKVGVPGPRAQRCR
jgi:type II secretory pathway component PulJ